jgi:hypothetical protein
MKLNIPEEYIPLIVRGLEHYYAYTRAVNRDDSRYRQAADWVKQSAAEEPHPAANRRGKAAKRRVR